MFVLSVAAAATAFFYHSRWCSRLPLPLGHVQSSLYGWKVIEKDDYWISVLQEALESDAMLSQPGRWLVEVIPSRRSSF
jgi:hypothetical protein